MKGFYSRGRRTESGKNRLIGMVWCDAASVSAAAKMKPMIVNTCQESIYTEISAASIIPKAVMENRRRQMIMMRKELYI